MSDPHGSGIGPPAAASQVNGLVLNLVVPGLGSLLYGRTGIGVAQIVMFGVGLLLCLTLIGILVGGPLIVAAWIWSLVTGVQMMTAAPPVRQPPPPDREG